MPSADLAHAIVLYLVFLSSLILHEFAHAWTARALGDPTPTQNQRVTLNPLSHLDLVGSVLLPFLFIFVKPAFPLIGWARPVSISLRKLPNPLTAEILIALAGPAANLLLCLLCTLLGALSRNSLPLLQPFFVTCIQVNALLFVLNLLPIPPLDGARLLRPLFRVKEEAWNQWAPWGFFVLLIFIYIPPFYRAFRDATYAIGDSFLALRDTLAQFLG